MTELSKGQSRRGARAAKRALRAAPLADEDRAVRPGMSGGNYNPLSNIDMDKINNAVMEALELVGLSQAIPSCVESITKAGGSYKDGRLHFPRALVEDTIANCAKNCTLALLVQLCTLPTSIPTSIESQNWRTCTTLRALSTRWTTSTFFNDAWYRVM